MSIREFEMRLKDPILARMHCVLFELGGITKYLMTGPSGNTDFCFPSVPRRKHFSESVTRGKL